MDNKPHFQQAKQKPTAQVEHGDIIVWQDPAAKEWKRGIVYNVIARPDTLEVIGFRLLPVETVGRRTNPKSAYDTIEKDNGSIVENAGGTPGKNKTVVHFNFRTFYNAEAVTQTDGSRTAKIRDNAWVLGSYAGSPYLAEIIDRVAMLHKKNEMYSEGKKIEPKDKITILDSRFAKQSVYDNRRLRAIVRNSLNDENQKTGTSSLADIARSQITTPPANKKTQAVISAAQTQGQPASTPIVHGEPEVQATETSVTKPVIYDIDLRDLVLVLNPGGERGGLTALRGGAYNENMESSPLIDPETGEKTKKLTTLREAWDYMKAVSPELNPSEIAESVKQTNNMSLNSAMKITTRFKEIVAKLDKVETIDDKPKSRNLVIKDLIKQDKLIVISP